MDLCAENFILDVDIDIKNKKIAPIKNNLRTNYGTLTSSKYRKSSIKNKLSKKSALGNLFESAKDSDSDDDNNNIKINNKNNININNDVTTKSSISRILLIPRISLTLNHSYYNRNRESYTHHDIYLNPSEHLIIYDRFEHFRSRNNTMKYNVEIHCMENAIFDSINPNVVIFLRLDIMQKISTIFNYVEPIVPISVVAPSSNNISRSNSVSSPVTNNSLKIPKNKENYRSNSIISPLFDTVSNNTDTITDTTNSALSTSTPRNSISINPMYNLINSTNNNDITYDSIRIKGPIDISKAMGRFKDADLNLDREYFNRETIPIEMPFSPSITPLLNLDRDFDSDVDSSDSDVDKELDEILTIQERALCGVSLSSILKQVDLHAELNKLGILLSINFIYYLYILMFNISI